MCKVEGVSCSSVMSSFKNVTVVITRDKYRIPPENYLKNENDYCFIHIRELLKDAQYAILGQPFMKTFYTHLNFEQNLVNFAVSTTVKVMGDINCWLASHLAPGPQYNVSRPIYNVPPDAPW